MYTEPNASEAGTLTESSGTLGRKSDPGRPRSCDRSCKAPCCRPALLLPVLLLALKSPSPEMREMKPIPSFDPPPHPMLPGEVWLMAGEPWPLSPSNKPSSGTHAAHKAPRFPDRKAARGGSRTTGRSPEEGEKLPGLREGPRGQTVTQGKAPGAAQEVAVWSGFLLWTPGARNTFAVRRQALLANRWW